MLPLTSTHWYTWQINFGGLNTDNMYEMSGTVAKLTEGALKFGRALGVLTNPKVRRYAGIVKICINSTFFFPHRARPPWSKQKSMFRTPWRTNCAWNICCFFREWETHIYLAWFECNLLPPWIWRWVLVKSAGQWLHWWRWFKKPPMPRLTCFVGYLRYTKQRVTELCSRNLLLRELIIARWRVQSAAHSGNLVELIVTLPRLLACLLACLFACLLVCLLVCWLIDWLIYLSSNLFNW